jgi:hypothetical protein
MRSLKYEDSLPVLLGYNSQLGVTLAQKGSRLLVTRPKLNNGLTMPGLPAFLDVLPPSTFAPTQVIKRRPQGRPEEVIRYPWIAITEDNFDATYSVLFPYQLSTFTADLGAQIFVDKFLFTSIGEGSENPIFVSVQETNGNLGLATVTRTTDPQILVTSSPIGVNKTYKGGTCFVDNVANSAFSFFEDNPMEIAWDGIPLSQSDIDRGGTLEAVPVGGSSFGRLFQSSGTTGQASTLDTTGRPPDRVLYTGVTEAESGGTGNANTYFCEEQIGFFELDTVEVSHPVPITTEFETALTGPYSVLYKRRQTGTQRETTLALTTSPLDNPDPDIAEPVQLQGLDGSISSGSVVRSLSEVNTYFDTNSSVPRLAFVAGFDVLTGEYSDGLLFSSSERHVYDVTVTAGTFPVTTGQTIDLLVNSGGVDSNDRFLSQDTNVEILSNLNALVIEVVDRGNTTDLLANIPVDLGGFATEAVTGPGAGGFPPPDQSVCDARGLTEVDFVQQGTLLEFDYQYTLNDQQGNITETYRYDAEKRYSTGEWFGTIWILVSSSGVRQRLALNAVNGLTLVNSDGPLISPSPVAPTVLNINGSTIVLERPNSNEIFDPETITWDPVAGEIADMAPGSAILYGANSLDLLDPTTAVLLPGNRDFLKLIPES